MTLITVQDGKVVLRDSKVGTEQECCCQCDPCLFRLCTAYAVCLTGEEGSPENEIELQLCDELAAQFLWLKAALESVGWSVTISEWPLDEIPQPGCDEEPFFGYGCRQKIVATCSLCDFYSLEDGEWLDFEQYAIDNPIPSITAVLSEENTFYPEELFGSFPCDPGREAGFPSYPGFCGSVAGFDTRVPVCNPLP
jgi:hypothetical protein